MEEQGPPHNTSPDGCGAWALSKNLCRVPFPHVPCARSLVQRALLALALQKSSGMQSLQHQGCEGVGDGWMWEKGPSSWEVTWGRVWGDRRKVWVCRAVWQGALAWVGFELCKGAARWELGCGKGCTGCSGATGKAVLGHVRQCGGKQHTNEAQSISRAVRQLMI